MVSAHVQKQQVTELMRKGPKFEEIKINGSSGLITLVRSGSFWQRSLSNTMLLDANKIHGNVHVKGKQCVYTLEGIGGLQTTIDILRSAVLFEANETVDHRLLRELHVKSDGTWTEDIVVTRPSKRGERIISEAIRLLSDDILLNPFSYVLHSFSPLA